MDLLILADDEELADGFEPYFDTIDTKSIADARVDAGDGEHVLVEGKSVEAYDALYLQADPRTAIFSRVFLETLLEKDIALNVDSGAFFILAKKNYLFQVLEERNVPIPSTAVVSTEKGISGIDEQLGFPLIGKKFEGFVRRDMSRITTESDLRSFVEHMDHGTHLLVLQEFVTGDVYDCLYVDGDVVSLKLDGEDWRVRADDAKATYHTVPSDLEEIVVRTAEVIGADVCRVRLVDGLVTEAYLNPALERFTSVSGKNMYEKVADYLKEQHQS